MMNENKEFSASSVEVPANFEHDQLASNFPHILYDDDLEKNPLIKAVDESIQDEENPLHIAAKLGNEHRVAQILSSKPEWACQFNDNGHTPLHLACSFGHLDAVKEFIKMDSKLCLEKDKDGRTPLHTAAMEGRIDIMKELLNACPDSVMETTETDETTFHIAMSHGQGKTVEFLLDWMKGGPCLGDLINKKDCVGNTLLHLAVSRKHLQIIKSLAEENHASVNAMNDSCLTALDIFNVLPPENQDTEIEKIFGRVGALTANELIKRTDCTNYEKKWYPFKNQYDGHAVSFVTATLISTTSFLATFFGPRFSFDNPIDRQISSLWRLFVLFDSIAFVTSTALMIIILVRELPLKPWLLVSLFSMFGAFTCSIKVVSPRDALPVLYMGSFTLVAAVSEYPAKQFWNLLLRCLSS